MKKLMRNKKAMFIIAALVLGVTLLPSLVIANPPTGSGDPPVASKINYQGQLTDSEGNPLDGNYDMEFRLYDSVSGGSQVGSTITKNGVAVTKGQFSVKLDVDQSVFNGQGLWLEVKVEGEALSPRQEILPVPYALSLKPGAQISGTVDHQPVLYVSNGGSGHDAYGLLVESADGIGVRGTSDHYVGVEGEVMEAGGYGVVGEASNDSIGVSGMNSGGGIGVQGRSETGVAISAEGTGRIESTADSYIFISGNEFIKEFWDDTTNWEAMENGGVAIYRGSGGGNKLIYIPITVPGVLYGQNVIVKELTIYYMCQDGSQDWIGATMLYKQTDAYDKVTIVDDENDQRSNTATSYTLTPTGNNVLSSDQGILGLSLLLAFQDSNNYIIIGGVRLTLGHSG